MFQSAPVIADGRAPVLTPMLSANNWFQSAPVIADGRARRPWAAICQRASFNPRPSSLTGEPVLSVGVDSS